MRRDRKSSAGFSERAALACFVCSSGQTNKMALHIFNSFSLIRKMMLSSEMVKSFNIYSYDLSSVQKGRCSDTPLAELNCRF